MKKTPSITLFRQFRRRSKRLNVVLVLLLSVGTATTGLQAQGPTGGTVRAGDARISGEGTASTRIDQISDRAIIDWRSFSIGAGDQVVFVQPSAQSATLNRVTGDQVSVILGRLDANGHVLLVNPNGVVFGAGSQVNVGSLIATTSNISNANFMAGRLVFDAPGRPGAGVVNAGAISAKDSGLVALVAPHVRNDGVIVARLGKVVLGSADTFTVDLYGDALINLALSDANTGQLHGANGEAVTSLITNTGRIEAAGGQTVLITARGAKAVLDNLINMSGTIKADTAVEQGGKILLLGEGGKVDVSGTLSAQGAQGGTIEALGDQVHVASTAALDASGVNGGGAVHVGGAFQGSGDTYRSSQTTIDAGAMLKANATAQGNGGEVVVWSDGHTQFAGAVQARGGSNGGDGGRLEVSGKGSLDFLGQADASAAAGQSGSLLLDPTTLDVGVNEASAITRVLRTGTSTTLQADNDINVNSAIYGGDRTAGGGLTMNAGNDINVNDFIVTNDGAVNLNASKGTVTVAAGKAVFAGAAPITVTAAGTLHTAPLVTGGSLSITSTAGSVAVDSFIDGHTGPVSIKAAGNVDINQPIVNFVAGDALNVTAGTDINVNAQVDGRGGVEGGAVAMTAARDVNVNQAIVTNNGAISLTATNGAVSVAQDTPIVAGTGAIALNARGNVTSGPSSGSSLTLTSSGGSVTVSGLVDAATGDTRITAASDVNINQAILNGQTGKALTVNAGRDLNLNAAIDGRGGVAGGTVSLTAGRNVALNDSVLTNNGALSVTANGGTATASSSKALVTGNAPITLRSTGDLTTGGISGGSLSAMSTGGSVRVNGLIDGATGRVDLTAANDVAVNQPVLNLRTGSAFNATAGHDVVVNAQIDGRTGATGGAVTLKAGHDVAINSTIATNNAGINVTATGGAATMGASSALTSGNGQIAMTAAGDVTTRGISGGSLSATSTGGSVNVNGIIDGSTGRVDLNAGRDVNVNGSILNTRSGASLNASAGQDVNVNAQIDGTGGAAGGAVNLVARGDMNVNAAIATNNGAVQLSAINGAAAIASGAGVYTGTAAIGIDALGAVSTGTLSGGGTTVTSRGGSIGVTGPITGNGGAITIGAAGQVDITHAISNPSASSPLTITAGTNINVNAPVGVSASATTPSGAVTMTAAQNVSLNDSVVTKDAAIAVTATNGTVMTAPGEGLFAGAGAITLQSGQTLSTGITSTTGALTLRSTGGSVNVDTAISGATGPVTISAANDVNVNQAIANPRTDAPLNITAGRNIAVNAAIDGRDNVLPGPGGTTTLTAGNNVAVNENVVARDSALSVTATGGALTVASGKGLFAGTGPLSLTSGQTFDVPKYQTSGALTLRSTGGAVNVNTAIDDTTGATTIAAGTDVNINQTVTNLKTGNSLTVTAGNDINVLAQVDGTNAVAGGTVTMTAARNLNLTKAITTNNGAVSVTATHGSVVVPVGVETVAPVFDPDIIQTVNQITVPMEAIISTGSAPVTITSGSDFAFTSPVKTTGSLTITSRNGNVTTSAPIADQTGAVTITAGNALVINREIRTADKDITLSAGAGGIIINTIDDHDYTLSASINPHNANLTLNSGGDVSVIDGRGIASLQTVSIDARGTIVQGLVGNADTGGSGRPQVVNLNGDHGVTFNVGNAGQINATSSGGSIDLIVNAPGKLRATTGTPATLDCPSCDIHITSSAFNGSIGPDVVLNAGGSVLMENFVSTDVNLTARSGDISLKQVLEFTQAGNSLTLNAGRDVLFSALTWIDGPLSVTAGRDIVTTSNSPIHVGNNANLTMLANRNLTMYLLEALGAVSFTATTGDITLNNDIGPHILNPGAPSVPDFNPNDLGVASLTISAPANTATITMQGARAEGDINITTAGTLNAAKAIYSALGPTHVHITAGSSTIGAALIGSQNQLSLPGAVSPVAPPGPKSPLPAAPGAASANGPGLPAFAEIPVSAADQNIGGVIQPGAVNASVGAAIAGGGVGVPGRTSNVTGRPGTPGAPGIAQANGSSDPGTADTASALRAAGQSCGEQGSQGDNGLAAVTSASASTDSADQTSAACASAQATGQPAAGVTGTSATSAQPAGSDQQ